ncbi:MAG: hypothetical protein K8J08_06645 [Thermoanaerobaculia bacterium]|nr:hypothetical protein [Thermoanaerobaculia bacterium]
MPTLPRLTALLLCLTAITVSSIPCSAEVTVIPTAEGQLGGVPAQGERIKRPIFEITELPADYLSAAAWDIINGTVQVEMFQGEVHPTAPSVPLGGIISSFIYTDPLPPSVAVNHNPSTLEDFYSFSIAVDGEEPQTLAVKTLLYSGGAIPPVEMTLVDNVETFDFPALPFSKTDVAVDNQGRATVVYTEFVEGLPGVRGLRFDSATGNPIDLVFPIIGNAHADPDIALLDPSGSRLIVTSNQFTNPPSLRGNIIDTTGPSIVVGPTFPIDSTVAPLGNIAPDLAADPSTGNFTVVWDHQTGVAGNPADIRARRFDAKGTPLGDDFVVNTTTANAQGQASVAYGPQELSAVAWTGDPLQPQGPQDLDVFLQIFDAAGLPIGGEIQVNTFTPDTQDQPTVRFLPDLDSESRPQVLVHWRDVGNTDGAMPRGTGTSYKCFSIEGLEDPSTSIFNDGFESGDTTSWTSNTGG